jgi:hypothetical protein
MARAAPIGGYPGSGRVHRQTRYQADSVFEIARIAGITNQEQALDCQSDSELLRNQNQTRTVTAADKQAEVARKGTDVMAHEHPILAGCDGQNDGAGQALQWDLLGTLESDRRIAAAQEPGSESSALDRHRPEAGRSCLLCEKAIAGFVDPLSQVWAGWLRASCEIRPLAIPISQVGLRLFGVVQEKGDRSVNLRERE